MPGAETNPALFVVTFMTGKRTLQLHCQKFGLSEHAGLFELSGIVFAESKVLLPEEETLRTEFKDVERVLLPSTAILRIDEMKKSYLSSEGPRLVSEKIDSEPQTSANIGFRRKKE